MSGKINRGLGIWLRDMALGAGVFLALAVAFASSLTDARRPWTMAAASAGEVIATRAVEVTAPPGPRAENAIVAAAQLRPADDPLLARRISDTALLGLTFSLLVALNMAFFRHLRRVNASPRRDEWRGRR